MKLHEIIKLNEDHEKAILIEKMLPYKRLLLAYYTNVFPSEPCLMVVSVSNAAQYGKIVPIGEFYEAMDAYINDPDMSDQDREDEMEVIAANSMMLSDL